MPHRPSGLSDQQSTVDLTPLITINRNSRELFTYLWTSRKSHFFLSDQQSTVDLTPFTGVYFIEAVPRTSNPPHGYQKFQGVIYLFMDVPKITNNATSTIRIIGSTVNRRFDPFYYVRLSEIPGSYLLIYGRPANHNQKGSAESDKGYQRGRLDQPDKGCQENRRLSGLLSYQNWRIQTWNKDCAEHR